MGASARMMLQQAAAERWQVDLGECRAEASAIHHAASQRRLGYDVLAPLAAKLPVPESPIFKPHEAYRLVGHSTPRKDTPAKVTGRAVYGIDVQSPGMLYAALRRSPQVASRVKSFDRAASSTPSRSTRASPLSPTRLGAPGEQPKKSPSSSTKRPPRPSIVKLCATLCGPRSMPTTRHVSAVH
jgi:isoquinoline 1-oxidoreductase subunit beta